jgi:DNA mismatch repair protein MutS
MSKGASITPLMAQYRKVKNRYPDAIVLFRMGDFYETFEEDAKIASAVLSLTLTKRANGAAAEVPLAGFPHHAINQYLPKLVKAGYRVAVCEQLEDPKQAKGIVKRDIVDVVTPGVNFSAESSKSNNYFAAIASDESSFGMAFCDATTGEFNFAQAGLDELGVYLSKVEPLEVLLPRNASAQVELTVKSVLKKTIITRRDDYIFSFEYAYDKLVHHFNVQNLKGFGISSDTLAIRAAGAALDYLAETQSGNLSYIVGMSRLDLSEFLEISKTSCRHLEVVESSSEENRTLFSILDSTKTPMGARLLRKILLRPLKIVGQINDRLDAVEKLVTDRSILEKLSNSLSGFGDLERLVARVSTKRASPRELAALRFMLKRLPEIKSLLGEMSQRFHGLWDTIENGLNLEDSLLKRLSESLADEPPAQVADGGVIRKGFNAELDELRDLAFNVKDWIARMQVVERQRTGIQSLKVDYNSVFGYYIEVTKANLSRVPDNYIRKQTLVNAERFITQELKEYEEKVLHAEEKIRKLEAELYEEIRKDVASRSFSLLETSKSLAILDVIQSFATVAAENNFTRPIVDESLDIEIEAGRHPVVEKVLPSGESFIPNDIRLIEGKEQIALITGPNMAGKSVFIRQVALIVLMAQAGSFVPAKRARIGIVDKIFTRVGASDNISAGESTFMVEMQEAAEILNNATPRSLVILDEIGRGTSTFDGLSIAWSIVEYLHENPARRARTLFATHYHELNELSEHYPRVKNFKADVREYGGKVVFLHKIVEGSADHSYGIHVAEMAGLPKVVTSRAREILKNLESFELSATGSASAQSQSFIKQNMPKPHRIVSRSKDGAFQIDIFGANGSESQVPQVKESELREKIKSVDINNLTPVDALNKIVEMKKIVEKEK